VKKILISAYAVSPSRGSECAVGWEISTRLAAYFDVTVLMCKITPSGDNYYTEIEEHLNKNGNIENIKFVPISMPQNSLKYTKLHDIGFWPAYYWGYNCWQKEVLKVAEELHKIEHFDAVYQLNMIGFREPGYLWKLDIPFFWGPTNGFHSIPFSFINTFKGKDFVFQSIKHISNELQILLASRQKKAAKKAAMVWCVDQVGYNKLLNWGAKTALMQETGLSVFEDSLKKNKTYSNERPLKLVWSGMITPGKALFILIEALLKIKDLNFELTVIGDGTLKHQMQKLTKPISNKIIWTGWVTKNNAISIVKNADLLIHTSLKEGTPHSILEAIGMGIPVMCHDTCGMGIVVNDNNGFKIPYKDSQTSINYIVNKLSEIIKNPEVINKKYKTIWETTASLTWDHKVELIAKSIENKLKTEI
jgi:glycosyltransferase involved in cell wall biosynthesis